MSTVPPTISSGVVITDVSEGDTVLALFLTIAINIIGIFTMPYVLDISLQATGSIDIDQTTLLLKMLFFVLLPFLVGKYIRKVAKREKVASFWSYVNSSCVISMVYASISTSTDAFSGFSIIDFTQCIIAVAVVHCLLLGVNTYAGRQLQLPWFEKKALLFVTSQKTLAIALAVLTTIGYSNGSAIIVCLTFHFFQLVLDSALASYLQKK